MDADREVAADRYVFDRGWSRERERLEVQARLIDAGTIRHVEALGPRPAWRCAEIGAGAGSIALWLARRLGDGGLVVATDVDTRFLDGLAHARLEVRRHDIVAGPLEEGAYDLVHTRLLLRHLPERARALRHMVASLRPGGFLLAEDFDLATAGLFHPPSELQARVNAALERLLERNGVVPRYGIELVGALRAAGLEQVQAEGHLRVVPLGSPEAEALALKLEQFRAGLVETGLVSAVHYPPLMVAAWGRRPAG